MVSDYIERLRNMKQQDPPFPWRRRTSTTVAALSDVGYSSDSDLLLVISNDGRGVFDCLTGKLVAREPGIAWEHAGFDGIHLTAMGIGPLEGKQIRVAGQHGGGLPVYTSDGWYLQIVSPNWPFSSVILIPSANRFSDPFSLEGATKVSPTGEEELIAYGFSETGRSFIVAQTHTLDIFSRG